jgi:hypothetical protein
MSDSPRVLLMRLSCRTSSRGNEYLSGFLGAAKLIGFKAKEPDRYGNEVWEIYATEPQQREQTRHLPPRQKPPALIDGQCRDVSDDDRGPPW